MTENHGDLFPTGRVPYQARHLDPGSAILLVLENPSERARRSRIAGIQDHIPTHLQDLPVLLGGGRGHALELTIRICSPKFEKASLKLGICRHRRRMSVIPDTQFRSRRNRVVALQDRLCLTQMEMLIQPVVEGRSGHRIVVVRKVLTALQHHPVRATEEAVKAFELREAFGGHLLGPIIGGSHALRFGRK